ncbi:MAG: hypothetical protein BWX88_03786 [Planctomycetes bacterium ADurb.Bin126]|nr:MAG: hypothetical protein BWX88_03786 [Planctomycetes bacterium ADurb.Bin126]HOD83416.1 PrsW family glutamic-type intramembrane protease [Phycisphaerae bacterium]HQL75209.1 PrsW family glutamic-type intramembrane protease [Phycisphaerae bacterium]
MSILVRCVCGKAMNVKDEHAGKRGRCPACGAIIDIPAATTTQPSTPPATAPRPAATTLPAGPPVAPPSHAAPLYEGLSERAPRLGNRMYAVLLLALVPLIWNTLSDPDDTMRRLAQTIKANPEVARQFEQREDATIDDLLLALPDHRVQGAMVARDSWVHWGMALAAGGLFFALAMVTLRSRDHKPRPLLIVGLFTGTLGILLLLGFQYVADWTQGVWVRGRGIVTILFYIVKFIGFSYRAAEDPSNGFLLSFVGYTCGVGFCEEVCKALPLLWHFRTQGKLTWRGAWVWGLVSGAGFGVAEGILYSSRYYNGLSTGGIYGVRFLSCVALHAIWSAAVGVMLYRRQDLFRTAEGFLGMVAQTIVVIAVPMVLHGLYDTLLKQDYAVWALVAAVASFAWLAWQVERTVRQERTNALPV